ncbi:MAG: GtrA family protein [Gammaproteobacteria bacterium]|nr:GtrA family protein [Gammaproteobacteria bacterium]
MNGLPHLLRQIVRFGLVGGLATLVHVGAFLSLADGIGFYPQAANLLAWVAAFVISFCGHFLWTFRENFVGTQRRAADALVRFLGVSLLGLGLNSGIVMVMVGILRTSNGSAALLMATLVPALLFVINRYWAFSVRPPKASGPSRKPSVRRDDSTGISPCALGHGPQSATD